MEPKFKVGQKVKVVTEGSGFSRDEIGITVTISEVGFGKYFEDQWGYRIKEKAGNNVYSGIGPNTVDAWHGEESFKLVVSEYNVGDCVRIARRHAEDKGYVFWHPDMDKCLGKIGIVKRIADHFDDTYRVEVDNTTWSFHVSALEPVSDEKKVEEIRQVGEPVKLLTLAYSGLKIELDVSVQFSRNFAEAFLNAVYEEE